MKSAIFVFCFIACLLLCTCNYQPNNLKLAETEIESQDYLGAIIRLNMHLNNFPDDDSALVMRAFCYSKVWKDSLSKIDLQAALRKNPEYSEAKLILGRLLLSEENYTSALAIFDKLVNDPNESIASEAWIEKGRIFYFSDDFPEAIDAFNLAVQKDSSNGMAWYYRGLVKSRFFSPSGETQNYNFPFLDLSQALSDFTDCIKCLPLMADAYFQRAMVHFNRFDDKNGMKDLNKAIDLAPNYIYYYQARAHQHILMRRYQEALLDLNYSISRNSKEPDAYIERAGLYKILGRFAEAKSDSLKAAGLD